ncbi:hypothetical protein E3N88_35491 [Mikania micrantha]|uniref:Uncharacterized protein n=1 Tax=Mikania micrantha TaxID=192012 RepID=A0A5N6M1L3_9ASTR|nr:hypothetical protein E3N88_35491 [Mikania micrantha]
MSLSSQQICHLLPLRTLRSWEPSEDFANRQGFENVLKDRYGDIMLEMRKESANNARANGGSVGYDEHRIRLEIKLGKKPTFKQLFLHTHLKKESKAKYWVGYYDDNPEGMEFCTNPSKEAYESYSIYMVEKYGEDETQHPIGDIDLWERSQGEKKQSFGIGSSDRHFILTGTPSSSIGSTPSNVMFEQS